MATLLLCRELVRMGLEVTCFAGTVDPPGLSQSEPFRIIGPRLKKGWRWDWPHRALACQAQRAIRLRQPTCVFAVGVTRLTRYLLESRVAHRVLVWELTNANPGNKFVDSHAVSLLSRARAMLSPSAMIDQQIRDHYGYRGMIARLPFWIEDSAPGTVRSEHDLAKDDAGQDARPRVARASCPPPYLLPTPSSTKRIESDREPPATLSSAKWRSDFIFLGRRDEEKGLCELVEATALVIEEFPQVRVLVAGSGDAEPYEALAARCGVSDVIKFHTFQTREDAMHALAEARYLVLPSYHEGYPLVLLEAARAGVPMIATPVGSIPEMFGDGEACRLVPVRDSAGLAKEMLAAMRETKDAYEARRVQARMYFERVSSTSAVASRLTALRALGA